MDSRTLSRILRTIRFIGSGCDVEGFNVFHSIDLILLYIVNLKQLLRIKNIFYIIIKI